MDWISIKKDVKESKLYYVVRQFEATEKRLNVKLAADTRFMLYINGNYILEGGLVGENGITYYETADLSEYVKIGKNEIVIKLIHIKDGFFTVSSPKDKPALWFSSDMGIESDLSWKWYEENGIRFIMPEKVCPSVFPFEEVFSRSDLSEYESEILCKCNFDTGCSNFWGSVDRYVLKERNIPQLKTYEPKSLEFIRRRKMGLEFDAGKYVTAKVRIKLFGSGDVRVAYSECYSFKDGENEYKADRTDLNGELSHAPFDIIHIDGGEITFESLWYRAFRYIRLESDNANGIEVKEMSYLEYYYPFDIEASFEASDKNYEKMWEISRQTMLCCAHELLVDCPYYEQQQYSMDSGLQMFYWMRLSGDYRLLKKAIYDIASSQTEEGFIRANFPSRSVQIIPNFSLYFIINVYNYAYYTGDFEIIRKVFGVIVKIINCFENYTDSDGLVFFPKYWQYTDWVEGWNLGEPKNAKKEPLSTTNLLYSYALKLTEELCGFIGKNGFAMDLKNLRCSLNENIIKHFYDEEKGMFKNSENDKSYSQHSFTYAVLSDIFSVEKLKEMAERIENPEVEQCSYSMRYYFHRALIKAQRYDIWESSLGKWNKMIENNCTTWFESDSYPRSECHAWSSTPVYEITSVVLGVEPLEPGFGKVLIKPYSAGLDYAKGTVSSPKGKISVDWKKDGEKFSLTVDSPEDIEKHIVLPNGKTVVTRENFFNINN